MRITNRMMADRALADSNANLEALARAQDQIASGKRLLRPSDSPTDVRFAVKASDAKAELEQYQRNVTTAAQSIGAADVALGSAGELMQRARELAVQGANGTLSASDRGQMASEVDQLMRQMVSDAAAKVGDQYVFSGFKTDTAPYVEPPPGGAVGAYQGDSGTMMARLGPTAQVGVNIPGNTAFDPAFAALNQLHAELVGGGPVSGGTITLLDAGINSLLDGRSILGARQNRLDTVASSLDQLQLAATKQLSDLVDVDMTQAITDLGQRQAAYQASLDINARVLQPTLLDHLR
jgi:flagellar hook-associated protein 3 FlgL